MTITNQPTAMDPLNPLVNAMGQMNLGVRTTSSTTQPLAEGGFLDSPTKPVKQQDEQNDDELDEVEEEMTYKSYRPAKLLYGLDHPDEVVENSTLAAVLPPDITYNLAIPANVIAEGKLSNLQLEAIVYGNQRHAKDLPVAATKDVGVEGAAKLPAEGTVLAKRCGFLLGDSAGMGKGRTLAGFVVENISRGRKKHIWVSVSSDLYEDAKRDLSDLGLDKYASKKCYNLGNYKSHDAIKHEEGVVFTTYKALIAKNRLDQLLQWCGDDSFDGLIMLDECHRCKSIELDGEGNTKKKSSKSAQIVVELQNKLPRARVVYCSATSVSEPKNLGFMSRLGLWGEGTEHPSFNAFLDSIEHLGTGAIELNAMHLKSLGALQARQLSYSTCDFELVDVVSNENFSAIYEQAAKIFVDLYDVLAKSGAKKTEYWAEHLRFFKFLAVGAKVDNCIATAKKAIEDGCCCVIGLQSTGEASSARAAKATGINEEGEGTFDRFVSSPAEGLKRLIRNIIAPEQVQSWIDEVEKLELPANALDRVFNELGGPDDVAELTGRKTRQVKRFDRTLAKEVISYEKRKLSNIEEKKLFQGGEKLIAIVSEAASTGISLHADKRVANQRRRVHLTLELPWSADKAIQQLGRTHRSNQSSAPLYKFLLSDIGGEARFASTVARRLASLGALTQGDRRATGTANALGLGSFDIDNEYGNVALKKMLNTIRKCSSMKSDSNSLDVPDQLYVEAIKLIDEYLLRARHPNGTWNQGFAPLNGSRRSDSTMNFILFRKRFTLSRAASIDEAIKNGTSPTIDVEGLKALGLNLNIIANLWMVDIDVNEDDFPVTGKKNIVAKFLSRVLGLSMKKQSVLMNYFFAFVELEVKAAKAAGKIDVGVRTLTGQSVEIVGKPRSFSFSKDCQIKLFKVTVDKGMTFEAAHDVFTEELAHQSENSKIITGFYTHQGRGHKIPKIHLIISPDNRSNKVIVYRPNEGQGVLTKTYVSSKIGSFGNWNLVTSEEKIKELWNAEYSLADIAFPTEYNAGCKGRHQNHFVFAGSIIPVLNEMLSCIPSYDDQQLFSVVRVEATSTPGEVEMIHSLEEEVMASSFEVTEDFDAIEIGQGVALEMKSVGSSVLRGLIVKEHEDGKWVAEFSNKRKFKLSEKQVVAARKLFEDEVASLVEANVPQIDAVSSMSETTLASSSLKVRMPLLPNVSEINTDMYEQLFEEHYQGSVPDTLIGIEFSNRRGLEDEDGLVLWESVLRNLSAKLLEAGAKPICMQVEDELDSNNGGADL